MLIFMNEYQHKLLWDKNNLFTLQQSVIDMTFKKGQGHEGLRNVTEQLTDSSNTMKKAAKCRPNRHYSYFIWNF